MQVIAHATFAAVTQPCIVTPVAQNTNLLTSTPDYAARVWYWRQKETILLKLL